jgi:hypothetical protein
MDLTFDLANADLVMGYALIGEKRRGQDISSLGGLVFEPPVGAASASERIE